MRGLLLALLLAPAAPAAAEGAAPLNLVVVTVNSLQAGRTSPYGGPAALTPNMARLAAGGTVFGRAVAQSGWTLPSLASLFTSRYPRGHGVYERGQELPAGLPTLAAALRAAGRRTAAFTGGLDAAGVHGLARGFDLYDDDTGGLPTGTLAGAVTKAAAWLAANKGAPFFLFLQGYDAHPPYDKPWPGAPPAYDGPLKDRPLDLPLLRTLGPGLPPADLAYVRARYDAGVAHADAQLGRLLDLLDGTGLSSSTVVVLTAEHGEELGERGSFDRFGTGSLYDEALLVPLIIRHPALKGGRVAGGQARLVDVMPTALELLGAPVPPGCAGASLRPALYGAAGEPFREALSEAGPSSAALRAKGFKLVREGDRYRLFDLLRDPGEREDAARLHPEITYGLAQELAALLREAGAAAPRDARRIELDPEMKRRLREAGYWR